jgi:hypothetical protein
LKTFNVTPIKKTPPFFKEKLSISTFQIPPAKLRSLKLRVFRNEYNTRGEM